MIKAECDRCGEQKVTEGEERVRVMLPQPFGAYLPRLPEGWRRVDLPAEDEAVQGERKELCPECVNALRKFFEGDGAVPGLLEMETLNGVIAVRCNCPQPEEPRPPCPVHESVEIKQDTIMRPECLAGQHETDPAGDPEDPACRYCGVLPDPRPNLTERARKIAGGNDRTRRCTCAGAGFGTEDCAVHHPDGLERGTHLKCFQDSEEGECPGIYRRGLFAEHMSRWHGIKVAEGSKACPYCATIERYITELGPHIAKEHPGDWQAWIDGGQTAG